MRQTNRLFDEYAAALDLYTVERNKFVDFERPAQSPEQGRARGKERLAAARRGFERRDPYGHPKADARLVSVVAEAERTFLRKIDSRIAYLDWQDRAERAGRVPRAQRLASERERDQIVEDMNDSSEEADLVYDDALAIIAQVLAEAAAGVSPGGR